MTHQMKKDEGVKKTKRGTVAQLQIKKEGI